MDVQSHILSAQLLVMSKLSQRAVDYSNDVSQWVGAETPFELGITRSLGQIAKQAHEMAEGITAWLQGKDCVGIIREPAACAFHESLPMRDGDKSGQIVLSLDRCFCAGEIQ